MFGKNKKRVSKIKADPIRGRVDPYNPDVIGSGAFKATARPIAKVKARVYRAKTKKWETVDGVEVKPVEGPS